MACEVFVDKKFKPSSLQVIAQANAIIEEYVGKGFVLTLRQLYYQFVARGLLENKIQSYDRLGVIVNDARLAGYIDWDAIEDRTRNLSTLPHWTSTTGILSEAAKSYRLDRWATQRNYCEVWVEKEALAGVMARVCNSLDVPFFACRGYVSQSEQYRAGKRLMAEADARDDGEVVIFHFGDHDPSGIDMTRDNDERLWMFSSGNIRLERLALNMDQVQQYEPPPNPAKVSDSRYETYVREYGDESWELDALDPEVLEQMVKDAVHPLIDWREWRKSERAEAQGRSDLIDVSGKWQDVRKWLAIPRKWGLR